MRSFDVQFSFAVKFSVEVNTIHNRTVGDYKLTN